MRVDGGPRALQRVAVHVHHGARRGEAREGELRGRQIIVAPLVGPVVPTAGSVLGAEQVRDPGLNRRRDVPGGAQAVGSTRGQIQTERHERRAGLVAVRDASGLQTLVIIDHVGHGPLDATLVRRVHALISDRGCAPVGRGALFEETQGSQAVCATADVTPRLLISEEVEAAVDGIVDPLAEGSHHGPGGRGQGQGTKGQQPEAVGSDRSHA